MQVINDAPITHPKPVPVTPLKLGDVVVRRIRADRNLFDLGHNSLLPVRRKARQGFVEGLCGDDRVHKNIVTISNI